MSIARRRHAMLAVSTLWLIAATAQAATVEHFTIVSNDENVGTLDATSNGDSVRIEYQERNNGRGPTISESLRLRQGYPVEWTVDGTTAFGGSARERMNVTDNRLVWESQADSGSLDTSKPLLYVANNGSPWTIGVYARALLAVPGHALDVAPSGRMQIEELGERRFGDASVKLYALTGIDLTPRVVLLDSRRRLFASLGEGASAIVRSGYEKHFRELLTLARELQFTQLQRRQQALAHRFDAPVRFRNVRIFDPRSGKVSEPVSVVTYRGRISSIGAEAPDANVANEVVIDGGGDTLIPGLHDMHSHSTPWSGLFYLAAGVTNVRDNGNDNQELLDLSSRIEAGELPGPRIWRAGLLEGRSPYSARIGFIANSLPEAIAHVRWYADHGYHMIKIYNSMNPDWVKPIAAEAHRLGLRVNGHVPAFMSPDRAIVDGYDEITHINQLALGWVLKAGEDTRTPLRLTALGERAHQIDVNGAPVRNTLELMKEHNVAFDPTIVILERLMLSRAGVVPPGDAAYLDHVPIGYQRYRKRSFVNFKSPQEDKWYQDSFQRLIDTIRVLNTAGIRILPGTDDLTGFTVHRELELYQQAGMTPAAILRMATLGCEEYMGQDQQLGSIEVGKITDFVLLQGNPVQDLGAVRRARAVMKDSSLYFPSEIYQSLGIRPFTTAPTVAPASKN